MKRSPGLLLLLALASGGAAAYLALGYLRDKSVPILQSARPTNQVVLAARDIQNGSVVEDRDIRVVDWPGEAVPPGFLRSKEEVLGRAVLTPIRLNEPVLESKLAPPGVGGGIFTLVQEGMRAISVRVDDVVGVAGFVIPASRVDVMLTMVSQANNEPTTQVILQNIRAISAGQTYTVDPDGQPQLVPVITVAVTPEQAETLVLAASQGRIQMALRSSLDTTTITTTGARSSSLFPGRRRIVSSGGRPRIVTPQAPQPTIIEGFRGGERTLTRFNTPRPPGSQ